MQNNDSYEEKKYSVILIIAVLKSNTFVLRKLISPTIDRRNNAKRKYLHFMGGKCSGIVQPETI